MIDHPDINFPSPPEDTNTVLAEKLMDAWELGIAVEFDPEEAEQAGIFLEDALAEEDALESMNEDAA